MGAPVSSYPAQRRRIACEEDGNPTVTFPGIPDEILTTAKRAHLRSQDRRVQLYRFLDFGSIGLVVFMVGAALQWLLLKSLGADASYVWQTVFSVELSYVMNRWLTWHDRDVSVISSLVKWNVQKLVLTVPNIIGYDMLLRAGMNWLTANLAATAAFTVANYVAADKWTFIREYQYPSAKKILRSCSLSLPLLAILAVQAGLALRLVWSNTAYSDEALYLWAGRVELASLLHGTPSPVFSSYFSGAPVIYPVLGALANDIGGLAGARLLSLGFMLGATALLWVTTRRLYGNLAAAFAAGSWAVLGPTLHLSAFATYDAMSMFLIALAVCLATTRRTREVQTTWMMVAAAVALALANATAYSSAIFDPVVVLLAIFSTWPQPGGFAAWRRGVLVSTVTLVVIYVGFWIGGDNYISGVALTILSRHSGTTLPSEVLVEAFRWTGAVVIAAVAGVILAAVRRIDRNDIRLLSVCVLAAMLVPLEQAHIHTDTSLDKHADMGVWFAAIVVGYAASKLITAWRPVIFRVAVTSAVVAGVAAMAVAGFSQGKALFSWPNSASYLSVVKPIVARTPGPLLIENDTVPEYYLPAGQDWQRWSSTFSITLLSGRSIGYVSKVDTSGNPIVYEALIKRGYFSLIIIDYSMTPGLDGTLLSYLRHDPGYHIVGTVPGVRAGTSTPIWERTNSADRSSK
jgi:putative flippase GtrA